MNGYILIDKCEDFTSHDVAAIVRGASGTKRVGHTGTLDPMATGLLLVCLGRATRAVSLLENDSKTYEARMLLGVSTDTQDTTGRVLRETDDIPSEEEVREALGRFRGRIEQTPPMYSAVKVNGQKLYKLARKGVEIERPKKEIEIFSLEESRVSDREYDLRVTCSKGTYIRTLINDIGERLGCGAAMSRLRRTAVGRFDVRDAVTVDDVRQASKEGRMGELVHPTDLLFENFGRVTVGEEDETRIRNGNDTALPDGCEGTVRVYSRSGEFLALCMEQEGRLVTVKSFFEV